MANQIPHTEDTKELLRRQRFEFLLKKTGKTAWERKNNGEMSLLEEWFFDNIICKHKLYEKYDIVNEHPEYPYFIDFAFLNIKLAVELDGQQHFKNGKKRIENDIKKDKLLNTKDWKVIRFSYDEDKIKIEKRFIDILNNIKNTNNKKLNNYIYKGKLKKLLPDRNWNQYILDRK